MDRWGGAWLTAWGDSWGGTGPSPGGDGFLPLFIRLHLAIAIRI